MHVLVLYESRRGFTLRVAQAIRDELRARGAQATCAAFGTVDVGTFAASDSLIVGSWISGLIVFRVGPAADALRGIDALPDLDGRPAAVFCTFDVHPLGSLDVMARRLTARGARVVSVGGRFRRRRGPSGVGAFVTAVLDAFAAVAPPG